MQPHALPPSIELAVLCLSHISPASRLSCRLLMTRHRPSPIATAIFLIVAAFPSCARHHGVTAVGTGPDTKRVLASSLLRNADSHKEHSLRDVLARRPQRTRDAKRNMNDVGQEPLMQQPASIVTSTERSSFPTPPPLRRPSTLSELFAWAIRMTTEQPPKAKAKAKPPPTQRTASKTETESESESLFASVRALADSSVHVRVRSLLLLEELCHSVDNGRDLSKSGGVSRIVDSLRALESPVRASAAWALATCSQNNPSVQNSTVELGAVPTLARLAAYDDDGLVRSRALFALNAVLELKNARFAFEKEPSAVTVVRQTLLIPEDTRAVRRALNLAELLVRKNIDTWKPKLEAYDVPQLVVRLMKDSKDIDVRESAARVIALLDGAVLS